MRMAARVDTGIEKEVKTNIAKNTFWVRIKGGSCEGGNSDLVDLIGFR